ncbi:Ribokinase-like protein [Obba rivulosa]|uniref:Ribokinase n=1 Tax=Obba rivulosa TaxID=1052685 RepID=A0A8E2AZN3_9APHY|nr:Ribokinase-like protein [Obba rivulosa]
MSTRKSRCLVRGSINIDEFFHVNEIVRPGETISPHELERRAGGKGANQAVAVCKAGCEVYLVGAVGDDGRWVVGYLNGVGVNVDGIAVVQEPTGRAIIQLAKDGENCIILHKGANYASLPSSNIPLLSTFTHLLLQNEIPFEETVDYLSGAHGSGVATIFNPSPMLSDQQIQTFPWEKLTWLVVNAGEAEHLHGKLANISAGPEFETAQKEPSRPAMSTTDHAMHLLELLQRQLPLTVNIVCTLGPVGVIALLPGLPKPGAATPLHIPAAKLRGPVLDTTGAGDCFTGYLVAGLMELYEAGASIYSGENAFRCLRRAVEAAGLCVQRRGAMDSIPLRNEVENSQ